MLQFVRSTSVVSRVIADETLIVPVRRGVGDLTSIYSLNPVGSAIWNALSEPKTKNQILETIQKEFQAPATASVEIDLFLEEMSAVGLVNAEPAEVLA